MQTDFKLKEKNGDGGGSRRIEVRGAWLKVSYSGLIVDPVTKDVQNDQYIYDGQNATIKLTVNYLNTGISLYFVITYFLINETGSDLGYHVNLTIKLAPNVRYLSPLSQAVFYKISVVNGSEEVTVAVNRQMPPGVNYAMQFYVLYINSNSSSSAKRWNKIYDVLMVKGMVATMDLVPEYGDQTVKQSLPDQYVIPVGLPPVTTGTPFLQIFYI